MGSRWGSTAATPGSVRRLAAALAGAMLVGCSDAALLPETGTVRVLPDPALLVGVGDTLRFTAAVDGPVPAAGVVWSTDDPAVASVDASGLARALAAGVTTVRARVDGAEGSAALEVYVPPPERFVAGEAVFGRKGYVEYAPGTLPLVLTAPHGGDAHPAEIPDRTFGVTAADRNTVELARAVREALLELTGEAPHLVLSHLHRSKLDPNREEEEAAQGNPFALQAWREFHRFVRVARDTVRARYGSGLLLDLHGHAHEIQRLELGYLLSAETLNRPDAELNAPSVVASSSVRALAEVTSVTFSELIRGPTSLGGLLQAEGIRSVPSPADPSPGSAPYFSGGTITREHGSLRAGETVSAIQIEHHFEGVRDTDGNRRAYAEALARTVRTFMRTHAGFFEAGMAAGGRRPPAARQLNRRGGAAPGWDSGRRGR